MLADWRVKHFADGLGLLPPGGRAYGGIRIRERVRPMKSAAELMHAAIGELGITDGEHTPIEPVVTNEGEYAAIARITGARNGQPIERTVAVLFGDDWYTRIDGVTMIPERIEAMRSITRELAINYSLGLGELRRRRYRYPPPRGWSGYPRGLVTEWHAPGFPAQPSSIAVFPARPIVETAAGALDRALHELGWAGFSKVQADEARPLSTPHFATGLLRLLTGTYGQTTMHQDIAVLQDHRFFYVCRLESTAATVDADRLVFTELLYGIEPLPHPRREVAPDSAVTAMWAD